MASVDVTQFLRQAGLLSHVIMATAANEAPEAAKTLSDLTVLEGAQWNVVIHDILGKAPRIDLVVITAEGERVVGSQHTRRRDGASA